MVQHLETLPITVVACGPELAEGDILPSHQHQRVQLVYASSGVITLTILGDRPCHTPQRAAWVPGSVAGRADHSSDSPQTRTFAVILDQIAEQPEKTPGSPRAG